MERRKEKQEQIMTTTIRLVTIQDAMKHVGYDICNFDDRNFPITEGVTLRVHRDSLVGEVKVKIAEAFGTSLDSIRVWNMVCRKNRTIRPEFNTLLFDDSTRIKLAHV